MNSKYDNLLHERIRIVEEIRNIQVGQSQALRQVQVPETAINMAQKFIKKVPNLMIFNNEKLYLRYDVLWSIDMDGGIYQLLARDAGEIPVQQANQKVTEWLDAIKGLLRYALNLLLAPKRPEFQNIKLYSSFYVYQIAKKLNEADKILQVMGYQLPNSQDAQELKIINEVDLELVLKTAADLVILQCDLELLKGNAKAIASEYPDLNVRIADILSARSIKDQTYTDTYNEAIAIAMSRSGYAVTRNKMAVLVPRGVQEPPHPTNPCRVQEPPYPTGPRSPGRVRGVQEPPHPTNPCRVQEPPYPTGPRSPGRVPRGVQEPPHSTNPGRVQEPPYPTDSRNPSGIPRVVQEPRSPKSPRHSPGTNRQQYGERRGEVYQRPYHTEPYPPGAQVSFNEIQVRKSSTETYPHSENAKLLQIQSDGFTRRGSAPSLAEQRIALNSGAYDNHHQSMNSAMQGSTPNKCASEGNLLKKVADQVPTPNLTSLSEEGSIPARFDIGSPSIEETNSMLISYSENMPRPNPDDLPEPVFLDEEALTANIPNHPHFPHNSSNLSYDENRVGIFVNARSTDLCDSLPMTTFSPIENDHNGFNRAPGNSGFGNSGFGHHGIAPEFSTSDVSKSDIPRVIADAAEFEVPNHENLASCHGDATDRASSSKNRPDTSETVRSPKSSLRISADGEGNEAKKPRTEEKMKPSSDHSLEQKSIKFAERTEQGFVVVTTEHDTVLEERENWLRNHNAKPETTKDDETTQPELDGSQSESNLDFNQSQSNLDFSDSQFNESRTWTCDYCTFLNANSDRTCEVCGIPQKSSN